MDTKAHPEILKRVKESNAREGRRLEQQISGASGIEAQFKLTKQQTKQECDTLRRELAQVHIAEKRERAKSSRYWGAKLLMDTDPTLLMMKEREDGRRRRNRKLLNRAKQKEILMKELVQDFVTKIDEELVKDKTRVFDPPPKSLLSLIDEPQTTPQASECLRSDELTNIEEEESRPTFYRTTTQDWMEAKKTRYVRTRILRDFEIELTPKEIFNVK